MSSHIYTHLMCSNLFWLLSLLMLRLYSWASGRLFKLASESFWHNLTSRFVIWYDSLLSDTTRCSRPILYVSDPYLELAISSKSSFLLLKMVSRNHIGFKGCSLLLGWSHTLSFKYYQDFITVASSIPFTVSLLKYLKANSRHVHKSYKRVCENKEKKTKMQKEDKKEKKKVCEYTIPSVHISPR